MAIDAGDYVVAKQIKNSETILTDLGQPIKEQTKIRNNQLARGEESKATEGKIGDMLNLVHRYDGTREQDAAQYMYMSSKLQALTMT